MDSQRQLCLAILDQLCALAQTGRPANLPRLVRHLEVSPGGLQSALRQLEQEGLIDARRLRLTLMGLAFAASRGAARARARREVAA